MTVDGLVSEFLKSNPHFQQAGLPGAGSSSNTKSAEISEVDIRGIQEQQMRIEVDPIKSQAVNVTLDDIQNAVNAEHQTISGGEMLMDGLRKTRRIEGEFKNAKELKRIVVKQDDFQPVFLEDVADVYFGNADTTSYAREFGMPVVMLDVKKQGGENLLDASDKINQLIEDAKKDGTIPSNVSVSKTGDHVITHFSPRFGLAIESLMNFTIDSIAFTQPIGTV